MDQSTETWKPIPNFEGRYSASDQGRIWSHLSGKHLSPTRSRPTSNRQAVTLMRDGRKHGFHVHRLVMLAFVSEAPDGMEICHNNGDDGDNRLSNLRFGTHQENIDDRRRHGTHTRGVDTKSATRFTEGDVRTIRRLSKQGFNYVQIAGMYGVKDKHHIKRIVKRKLWAWVDDPVMLHDSRANIEKRKAA